MKNISGVFGIALIAVSIGLFVGWVMNIIALFGLLSGPLDAMFVARIVGVFAAPLGGVLGWL